MNIEKRIHRRVGEAIRRHRMIEAGDKILVGISGGKDSGTLTKILAEKQRYLPIDFELSACHVVMDLFERNPDGEAQLDQLMAELDVPLHRIFLPVKQRLRDDRPMNCFFCAMQRRKAMLSQAKTLGCNKIAYGHHMDDIVETLLMNMFFNAEISTMPARLELDNHEMVIIRPLCLAKEHEVATYARRFNLVKAGELCPYGIDGRRARIKRLITELAGEYDRIRDNLYASLKRVKTGYLSEKNRTP